MKRIVLIIFALLAFLGIAAAGTARAQYDLPESGGYLLSPEELDELLSPIALYPDPLLAQILPAATFVDQIDEAARFVGRYGATGIDDQPWDISVRAIAHYPDILNMMDRKPDWTAALGQAFINQEQDVMDAIQRLRAEAEEAGNLRSTPQMEVYDEEDAIRIVPADPNLIYVPRYDPAVVYFEPAPSYGFITFSIGFTIGAWLNRDCDWQRHRVFYHGWRDGGWVGRARPHIHDRRNIYINNSIAAINVNSTVMYHNTSIFRNQLRQTAQRRVERLPAQVAKPRGIRPEARSGVRRERPRPAIGAAPTPSAPRPAITVIPQPAPRPAITVIPQPAPRPATGAVRPAERPDFNNFYRGREIKGPQPAARSGYGGYGSGSEATIYRQRGQSSLENMGRFNRQQQRPVQVPRPAMPKSPAVVRPAPVAPRPVPQPAPVAPRPAPPAGGGVFQQMKHR